MVSIIERLRMLLAKYFVTFQPIKPNVRKNIEQYYFKQILSVIVLNNILGVLARQSFYLKLFGLFYKHEPVALISIQIKCDRVPPHNLQHQQRNRKPG